MINFCGTGFFYATEILTEDIFVVFNNGMKSLSERPCHQHISTLVLTGFQRSHRSTYMLVIHMQMLGAVSIMLDSLRDWRVCLLI